MIENLFKKWLELELDEGCFTLDELRHVLRDEKEGLDAQISLWDDFEKWHQQEFGDMVNTQIRAILKKRGHGEIDTKIRQDDRG